MPKLVKWSFREYIISTFEYELYDASLKDPRIHTSIINDDFIKNKRDYYYNYGDLRFLRTEMRKYVILNTILYNSLIKFGVHNKFVKIQEIQELFEELKSKKIEPDIITYTTYMKALDNAEKYDELINVFEELKSKKIEPNIITYNTYMKALDNAENYEKAQELFNEMKANKILHANIKTLSKTEIDIHGLADIVLKYYLKDIKDTVLKTRQFKIICGRGLHSDNGAVLKPTILEFCAHHHLLYKIDSCGGRIIINP